MKEGVNSPEFYRVFVTQASLRGTAATVNGPDGSTSVLLGHRRILADEVGSQLDRCQKDPKGIRTSSFYVQKVKNTY